MIFSDGDLAPLKDAFGEDLGHWQSYTYILDNSLHFQNGLVAENSDSQPGLSSQRPTNKPGAVLCVRNSLALDTTATPAGSATSRHVRTIATAALNTATITSFTIEISVRFIATTLGTRTQTFLVRYGSSAALLKLQVSASRQIVFYLEQSNGVPVTITGWTTIIADKWYHLAAVGNGERVKCFLWSEATGRWALDGEGFYDGSMLSEGQIWAVGRGYDNTESTVGYIDEVRISSTALDETRFLWVS